MGPAVPALRGKHLSPGPRMWPLGSQVASTQTTGMLGPFAAVPETSGAGKARSKPCPRDHLCPRGEVRVPGSCGVCRFLPRIRSWQVKLRKTPASEDCELPSGTQEPCAGDLGLKPLGARRASTVTAGQKLPHWCLPLPVLHLPSSPCSPKGCTCSLPCLWGQGLLGLSLSKNHRADGWRSLPESSLCSLWSCGCHTLGVARECSWWKRFNIEQTFPKEGRRGSSAVVSMPAAPSGSQFVSPVLHF